jgi:hypothetical protein
MSSDADSEARGSAWRWTIFQSPCSRRKTVVTRSMYGWGGAPLTDAVAYSNATV